MKDEMMKNKFKNVLAILRPFKAFLVFCFQIFISLLAGDFESAKMGFKFGM